MSVSLNRSELIGNLTKDPEIRQFEGGGMVANFSVATNRSYKTAEGEKKDLVDFHNVAVFGKLAEVCEKYLKKGAKVFVAGRLQTRQWEKDGEKRYTTEIIVNELVMLNSKKDGVVKADDYQGVEAQKPVIDDLPF